MAAEEVFKQSLANAAAPEAGFSENIAEIDSTNQIFRRKTGDAGKAARLVYGRGFSSGPRIAVSFLTAKELARNGV